MAARSASKRHNAVRLLPCLYLCAYLAMATSRTEAVPLSLSSRLAKSQNSTSAVMPFGPPHRPVFTGKATVGALTQFTSSFLPSTSPLQSARNWIFRQWGLVMDSDYAVKNMHTSQLSGITHIYLRQLKDGLEVVNADMNINIGRGGRLVSYGSSFVFGKQEVHSAISPKLSLIQQLVSLWSSYSSAPTSSADNTPPAHIYLSSSHTTLSRLQTKAKLSPAEALTSLFEHLQISSNTENLIFVPVTSTNDVKTTSTFLKNMPALRQRDYSRGRNPTSSSSPSISAMPQPPHYLISKLSITQSDIPIRMAYIQDIESDASTDDKYSPLLKLVYDIELELNVADNWYHAHVCAETGRVLSLVDWVADSSGKRRHTSHRHTSKHSTPKFTGIPRTLQPESLMLIGAIEEKKIPDATYRVYPFGVNDPTTGNRALVINPHSKLASPLGWHSGDIIDVNDTKSSAHIPTHKQQHYQTTKGNNVIAHENLDGNMNTWKNNYRPSGGNMMAFDFDINLTQEPRSYLDAAVTQLFYTNNMIHDLFYPYGFNEQAGNFQQDNFDHGGQGNDAVIANAQDGSGYSNANFATPPDGQHGKMRMYVWNSIKPMRDGDLESGIVIHEYSHGISTRLTGGPANSGCLGWGEAGGMGEGWGDTWATILSTTANSSRRQDYEMGAYSNGGHGIRRFKYSTNMTTNPSTYSIMNQPAYWGVHAKGEVWAVILLEVYWNLVDTLGFHSNWSSASLKYGNTLFMHLIIQGLKIQPCRPNFIQARDAILSAEEALTNTKYSCHLWRGFAKRGLGLSATVIPGKSRWDDETRADSFELPTHCQV